MYIYIYTYTCVFICVQQTGRGWKVWGSVIYTYMYIGIYMYIYVYTYTYIFVCIHVYTYIYTHTYIYIYIHTYTCIYIHTNTHIYIYIHIYVYVYVYIVQVVGGKCGSQWYIYTHIYMYTCINIYISTRMYIYIYIYMCMYMCTTYRSWVESVDLSEQLLLRALLAYRSQRLPQANLFKSVPIAIFTTQPLPTAAASKNPPPVAITIFSIQNHRRVELGILQKYTASINCRRQRAVPVPTFGSFFIFDILHIFLIYYMPNVICICPKILKLDL